MPITSAIAIPTTMKATVKALATTVALLSWPVMMATDINPSPIEVAGVTTVALLAVNGLIGIISKLIKRQPTSPQVNENSNLRDMMLREFGNVKGRLDSIEVEVKINRERYHDLAGVLSTVAAEMKLLLSGRINIKPPRGGE